MRYQRLGDMLRARQLVSETDLAQALRLQDEVGGLIGQALLRIGAIAEDDLLHVLSEQLQLDIINPPDFPNNVEAFEQAMKAFGVTHDWLLARECLVWMDETGRLCVTAQNILDPEIRERVERIAYQNQLMICYYLASNQTIETGQNAIVPITDGLTTDNGSDDEAQRLRELAEEAPVIDFVNRVFSTALKDNASDIHIEPFETKFQVRYRIDGVLHTRQTEGRGRFDAVVSRVKLLSGMDIAERRLPQDGRQSIRFSGQDIDLRVSSLPGSWGESLVLRLLRKEGQLPDLQSLGLDGHAKAVLEDLFTLPNGVILVTGPTGSGKSTTLYRGLQGLNDGDHKIITIEDPVEYDMDGVIQIQTNANIGYTFAKGLRAILRQDPDIIMVGEIRDGETATIAAQAALTGHLVLSTLHTNSALAAVARLIDIGLEPYMVVSAVRGLAAQRLVRKLCEHCSVSVKSPDGEDKIWAMIESVSPIESQLRGKASWRAPKGCAHCSHTGYQGRIGLFEVARIDDALSDDILKGASLQGLMKTARAQGFITLLEDGILKARAGHTSLTEVFRVCGAAISRVDLDEQKSVAE